jgi:hypothetical protein
MIPRIPGLVPNIPSVGMKASVDFFFDRAAVQAAMSAMDLKALSKASMLVKDRAKRIIKKRGLARLPLKVQEKFPGAGITSLMQMGVLGSTPRANRKLGNRIIREVQRPPASAPGTPPHTHTPYAGHFASYLGFRRNLWNYYDSQTHSAVVGPSKKGRMIPYLHEFGGVLRLRTWVYIPQVKTKRGGMRQPITMKLPTGQRPHNQTHWRPMSLQTVAAYPARPFMKPAMEFCVANGSIAKAFAGQFKSSAGARGTGFTVRRG